MEIKKRLFLHQVYRYDKRLFWGMVFFTGFTLIANLSGDEIVPFFVWGMYSEKEKTVTSYPVFKITVNDSLLVDYSRGQVNKRFFQLFPLSYYKEIIDNNGEDPTISFLKSKLKNYYPVIVAPLADRLFNAAPETDQFLEWYHRYLEESTYPNIRKIQIEVLRCSYNQNQAVIADSTYIWKIWKTYQ